MLLERDSYSSLRIVSKEQASYMIPESSLVSNPEPFYSNYPRSSNYSANLKIFVRDNSSFSLPLDYGLFSFNYCFNLQ
jgi:hypothetical protein